MVEATKQISHDGMKLCYNMRHGIPSVNDQLLGKETGLCVLIARKAT